MDICPEFHPTICCDILSIPLDKWEPGYFDHIHASPPCTMWSRCRNTAKTKTDEDMLLARRLALHALVLIRHLKPKTFSYENPESGSLKHETFLKGYSDSYKTVSYCKYSIPNGPEEFLYKKDTRIWYGGFSWNPMRCFHDCPATILGKRHQTTAQRGTTRKCPTDRSYTQIQLYRIPRLLVLELLEAITSIS